MPVVLVDPPRTVEPSSSTPAAVSQGNWGEDDQLSLASTVEDTEAPETPARLTSPFIVDIRYNPQKKSWADLDEEGDDEWMVTSTAPLDTRYNPEKNLWADLDEEDADDDAAATAATPEENPVLPTAKFKYWGCRPRFHKES